MAVISKQDAKSPGRLSQSKHSIDEKLRHGDLKSSALQLERHRDRLGNFRSRENHFSRSKSVWQHEADFSTTDSNRLLISDTATTARFSVAAAWKLFAVVVHKVEAEAVITHLAAGRHPNRVRQLKPA